ncbi:hypothetical protein IVG45_19160 [Methylomonas sp. LL1]|uniref:hypothetical protein n=1 Tax=Methylomonas sp. LL1 TaxID=2785785 RepID=UPI0018C3D0D3|nr:hypothetical protein [Methylomonas sp. LL1]QPK65711.1 hypothetical protein IVG45_19160 [Methylomonas sp. LL1]
MMSETDQSKKIYELTTAAELAREHPALFTQRQLDWLIKSRKKNGLQHAGAVLKVGRRLYLDKAVFFQWFLAQR